MAEREFDDTLYPSIGLAYELARGTYELAVKRFDAMDAKLNTLTTFAVTASLAVPVIANSKNLSFHSWWFALAAIAFIVGIALATYARVSGTLMLLDPMVLHQEYLHKSHHEFQADMTFWAGKHFEQNRNLINRNGRVAAISAGLFALEAASVAAWVLSLRPL